MESKNKYHTVGTVPKPNRKIVEHRLNRYPYDTYTWPSLSWLDADKKKSTDKEIDEFHIKDSG
jgi:hypothetical protein